MVRASFGMLIKCNGPFLPGKNCQIYIHIKIFAFSLEGSQKPKIHHEPPRDRSTILRLKLTGWFSSQTGMMSLWALASLAIVPRFIIHYWEPQHWWLLRSFLAWQNLQFSVPRTKRFRWPKGHMCPVLRKKKSLEKPGQLDYACADIRKDGENYPSLGLVGASFSFQPCLYLF